MTVITSRKVVLIIHGINPESLSCRSLTVLHGLEIEGLVEEKMLKYKTSLWEHVEAKHVSIVQSVQSFAHPRMPGITTKVDITRACETII